MLKKNDLLFLAHLRQDSRQTLTKISRKTNMPISTLYDKLKQLEKKFIQKHTSLVDFTKFGFNFRIKLILAVNKEQRKQLKAFLKEHASVNNLFKINNGYDFLVEAVFKNVNDQEDFLELIDEKFDIHEKQMFHVIEDLKRETFLGVPERLPEIIL